MKRKLAVAVLTGMMACSLVLTGCVNGSEQTAGNEVQTEEIPTRKRRIRLRH